MYSYSRQHARHVLEVANSADALGRQGKPDTIDVDFLAENGSLEDAVKFYRTMHIWSETKHELSEWVKKLYQESKAAGRRPQIIVWDDTGLGIPWELYRFKADRQTPTQWLGVLAEVIRWTTVHDRDRYKQFSAERSETTGSTVFYFEDPSLVRPQESIYDHEHQYMYRSFDSLESLVEELDKSVGLGLVYIRGHGSHAEKLEKATLAGVSLEDMSMPDLRALDDTRPLVFLNACNSARRVTDQAIGDEVNRNFAEIFLRRNAGGVLATLAEVDILTSAGLAQELIVQARDCGIRISEFLRAERERHAMSLPGPLRIADKKENEENRKKVRSFLRACMFAYFGHPDSVFRLAAP
jgi:hypothetical protein